jgi:hypothetical protein
VLRVVYLIFNEGYAATEGDRLVRDELCDEAIRLGELLCRLMPEDAEVWGLSALMLLHDARRAARVDAGGRYVALDAQDRSLWDQERIVLGLAKLERAVRIGPPGEYQLQAAITAAQLQSPVDWDRIAGLYGALAVLQPSPAVELNHAVAIGFASGPAAGLALLEPLRWELERHQPLHAAHADPLRRAGDTEGAARAYERADDAGGAVGADDDVPGGRRAQPGARDLGLDRRGRRDRGLADRRRDPLDRRGLTRPRHRPGHPHRRLLRRGRAAIVVGALGALAASALLGRRRSTPAGRSRRTRRSGRRRAPGRRSARTPPRCSRPAA